MSKNKELIDQSLQASKVEESEPSSSTIRKDSLKREWDKPKLKEKVWEKHIQKLRNERKKCFAPPQMYEKAASNRFQKKQQKNKKSKETIKLIDEDSQQFEEKAKKTKIPSIATSSIQTNPFSNNFYPMMFPPPPGLMPTMMFGQPPPPHFFYPFPFQMGYTFPPNAQPNIGTTSTDDKVMQN